jgi:hypothetical protein
MVRRKKEGKHYLRVRVITYQYLYASFIANHARWDIITTKPASEIKK